MSSRHFSASCPKDGGGPGEHSAVNLFRTHTNVVTKPHQDKEEFIILYVLNRDGDGQECISMTDDGLGPGFPENVPSLSPASN